MYSNTGDYVNPIEKAAVDYLEAGGSESGLIVLEQAHALAQRLEQRATDNLDETRDSIRRTVSLTAADLRRLRDAALRIGTESRSPLNQYALIELVHAAAVANVALPDRIDISRELAAGARAFGRFERARAAYADALEGLQILVRFYHLDARAAADAESQIRRRWEALQAQYPGQRMLFASRRDDPAGEWLGDLSWNTDTESAGPMSHCDAVLRLAMRFEYERDERGAPLAPQIERMRELVNDGPLAKGRDDRWRVACMQAVGDALMEVSEWSLARDVHEQVAIDAMAGAQETLALHSTAQTACCHMFEGARDRALARIADLDWGRWQMLAQMAVSVAADMARVEALRYACHRGTDAETAAASETAVQSHLAVVTLVARTDPSTRVHYLQGLYAAVTSRDVNSIMRA